MKRRPEKLDFFQVKFIYMRIKTREGIFLWRKLQIKARFVHVIGTHVLFDDIIVWVVLTVYRVHVISAELGSEHSNTTRLRQKSCNSKMKIGICLYTIHENSNKVVNFIISDSGSYMYYLNNLTITDVVYSFIIFYAINRGAKIDELRNILIVRNYFDFFVLKNRKRNKFRNNVGVPKWTKWNTRPYRFNISFAICV